MTQSSIAIAMISLLAMASAPGIADDTTAIASGAGAGFIPASRFDLQPVSDAGQSRAVFGGVRLNSRYGIEGFYSDIDTTTRFNDVSSNLYTRSVLANSLTDYGDPSVAGVSLVVRMTQRGPVKPFARAGVHYYDPSGGSGLPGGGGKLMLGAGADIDLSGGWNTRFEWERYSDVGRGDRSIFSMKFEYKF